MQKNQIHKISIIGLIIAISIILSYFNPMLPLLGIPGMRISFSSYISVIPSFLFGPIYGGISMAITDILSYFLVRPEGGYMFPLTLTAAFKGVLIGLMCMWINKKDLKLSKYHYLKVLVCLFPANIIITTINTKLLMILYSISKAFWVFYLPRLAEEIINTFIQCYIVSYLILIIKKSLS